MLLISGVGGSFVEGARVTSEAETEGVWGEVQLAGVLGSWSRPVIFGSQGDGPDAEVTVGPMFWQFEVEFIWMRRRGSV